MLPKLTLVLGGAASGKSAYAERLVTDTAAPRVYLATAEAWDDEMRAKVARHRDMRGRGWHTVEAPLDVMSALHDADPDQVVLLDCATMWLSNSLLAEHDLDVAGDVLLAALAACPARVVVVSNEVGQSGVPDNAMARRFREAQGTLNQRIAAQSDLVVAVMAGLPMVLKGRLPGAVA